MICENYPLFESLTLYNQDGNIINVNSLFECAHYVNGVWSSINYGSVDMLMNISNFLLSLAVLVTCIIKFKNVKK